MKRALVFAGLLLFAALFVAPLAVMVAGSLKPDERVLVEAGGPRAVWPADPTLQNYRDVFDRADFGRFLLNSLLITGAIVLAGLVVNSLAGYATARLRWRGRTALLALTGALMIIPLEAIAVPLYYMVAQLGWRDTYVVQIVPFVANAFAIYLFHVYFRALPRELEESAWIDGAGILRTFVTVIVPNARPAFASVAILTFLMWWGSFLWPSMVTSGERVRPLPVAIASFHTLPPLQWGDILAFGVMMVAPVVVVFVVFQRWFVRSVASTGVKG